MQLNKDSSFVPSCLKTKLGLLISENLLIEVIGIVFVVQDYIFLY